MPVGIGGVAGFTFLQKGKLLMVWIYRLVVIVDVARSAGIRCVGVCSLMAGKAVARNGIVSARKGVIVAVNGESRRLPTGIGGMTIIAVIGNS